MMPSHHDHVDRRGDQLGDDEAADAGHCSDRQVDLGEQQRVDLGRGEQDVQCGLHEQVDQVPRREERRLLDLEEDHDQHETGQDRQRAALAAADPLSPRPQVLAERIGQDLGGGRGELLLRRRLLFDDRFLGLVEGDRALWFARRARAGCRLVHDSFLSDACGCAPRRPRRSRGPRADCPLVM